MAREELNHFYITIRNIKSGVLRQYAGLEKQRAHYFIHHH
jgi:hypothetical protein